MANHREIVYLLLLFFLAWFLRRSFIMYPLMLVITLLHEFSHALAAQSTGGVAERITVRPNGSGFTTVQGGWPLAVYNAGYLGSNYLGALIFILSDSAYGEYSLMILAGWLVIIAGLWVRDAFTLCFSIGVAIVLFALSFLAADALEIFLSKFIAVCCVLYSFLEINWMIKNHRQFVVSDAEALRRLTGIPAFVWKLGWQLISVLVMILLFRFVLLK